MTERSAQQIWEAALGQLEIEVNRSNFRTWLSGTAGVSYSNGEFTVGVPNTFVAEFLDKNLRSLVSKTLASITRCDVEVRFCVNSTSEQLSGGKQSLPLLNPGYTFDTFVVGSSNRLAYAAAQAVAEEPGRVYNPLLIHGSAGLGKTHLLHAMGHAAASRGLGVLYVSSEQFTNEVVSAIRGDGMQAFRDKYRTTDMLLVDDIQFFGGKERTRESFFHTFNALHAANRQIAVTCDCPPQSIPHIQERLRSRLEWGLVTDLKPPDFETRLSILQAKARREGVDITPDVLELIALEVKENIRRLEGSLNRVIAYARLVKTMITPDLVLHALDNIASKECPTEPPSLPQISEAVAASFQLPLSALKGRKRDNGTALARQVAMYLMRQETDSSLADIGRELGGRAPATVSHAYEKIATTVNGDPHLRRQVFNIQQELRCRIPTA